ncbi:MAG: NUDIX domain-containing protein [Anaerolineales bacterium]|nr:NUDIX domain-containing protein [Anaerolineales bacterium]
MFVRLLYLGFKIYCFIFRPVRMGVRVMMIQNEKVWLVRHTYVPGWHMPGGGVKRGETLEAAARREAFEETGAQLGEVSLMGAYTSFIQWKTDHAVVFICRDFMITGRSDGEIAEVRDFPLDELPRNVYLPHRLRLDEVRAGKNIPQFGEW